MELSDTVKEEMLSVTVKLQKIEDTLSAEGYKGPIKHIELDNKDRIRFPLGYIRKVVYFKNEYNLFLLIDDKNISNNISYAFQMSDFFNYLLNRFNVFWSLEHYLTKYAILNSFSIYEALLHGIAQTLHNHCEKNGKVCKMCNKCAYYIKSPNNLKLQPLINLFINKINISEFEENIDTILFIKELRDNIHIWQTQYNEYGKNYYNLVNYNKIMKVLHTCKNLLPNRIEKFKNERNLYCNSVKQ